MTIYTFQPQELIDIVNNRGYAFVDFPKTNLYKQSQIPGNSMEAYHEAYMWMARKLSEKTGVWMKGAYGEDLDLPKDSDGDYIDEEGRKLPVLPFWGWYITDGKKEKPDASYCFDRGDDSDEMDWNLTKGQTRLVTLEVPEKVVLLSDANAWYCALEGRPCYEYEEGVDSGGNVDDGDGGSGDAYDDRGFDDGVDAKEVTGETRKNRKYKALLQQMIMESDEDRKTVLAQKLYDETISSWDNILRLEGRRLRSFPTPYGAEMEKYDIQAAFPVIMKEWIVAVDEV